MNTEVPTGDKAKLEEYYKLKIQEAFNLFVKDKKGFVIKEYIPYIMRYLGRFPSEAQVVDVILPQIQDDEPSSYVKYTSFEPFMLKVLTSDEKEYEPDDPETLIAAFKILDPDGKGYIEVDTLKNMMMTKGIPFRQEELDDFLKFAVSKDSSTSHLIYYEDYVSKLQGQLEKHMDNIMKGYSTFIPEKNK